MGLSIFAILSLSVLAGFLLVMFFTTEDKNKMYLQYILTAYPLIAMDMLPAKFNINGFDLLTFLFLFAFYTPKKGKVPSGYFYLFIFILILSSAIIGCINAESLANPTVAAYIQLASIFIFAKILIDECAHDASFFEKVIDCLKVSLIVSLLFLFCQLIFGVGFTIAKTQNPNVVTQSIRYPSFFQDPQKFAQFLAGVSFLFLIKKKEDEKLPMQNYIFVILSLIAILLAGGRAALGGWGAGLLVVILFGKSSYRFAAVFICLVVYIVVYNFQDSFAIFKRASLEDSYDFRYAIWQDAYIIFTKHPFFGIGLGNYPNYVSVHNPDQYWVVDNEIEFFGHPESGYLKFLTELGAVGFGAIYLLILIPCYKAFRQYLKSDNSAIIMLLASIGSWMVGFYTVYSFDDVRIKILVITILCLIITSYKWDYQLEEDDE